MLSTVVERRRETTIRLALGASRGDIVRLFVTEGYLLGLVAAGGASLLAGMLRPVLYAVFVGRTDQGWSIAMLRPFLGALILSFGISTVVGIIAARQALTSGSDLAFRDNSQTAGNKRMRWRSALLVAQSLLAIVLLSGSALFVQSLRNVRGSRLGIDVDRILVVDLPSQNQLSPTTRDALIGKLQTRASAIPGISATTLSVGAPLMGQYAFPIEVSDSINGAIDLRRTTFFLYAVTGRFFAVTGIAVIQGRALDSTDRTRNVVVVNRAMADRLWPGQDPIGKCFHIDATSAAACTQVVGLAENSRRQRLLETAPAAQYYMPFDMAPPVVKQGGATLLIRIDDAARRAPSIQKILQETDPNIPYVRVRPLLALASTEMSAFRLAAVVFTAFGVLAALTALMGLFSALRYSVVQRTPEIGIRRALGAQTQSIYLMIVGQGVVTILIGCVAGTLIVIGLGGTVSGLLLDVSPTDPKLLIGTNVLFMGIAAAACSLPATRATRIDPAQALRGAK